MRQARVSAASIIGALVALSVAIVVLSDESSTGREIGLAVLSGGVVGASLVVVESLLARADDVRRSHEELVRMLSVTRDLNGIDLTGQDLSGVYLPGRALVAAHAAGASFARAKLLFGDLRHANLAGVDLRAADLSGATLAHATLDGADLRGAILDDTDLSHANLQRTQLDGTHISGGRLVETDLTGSSLVGATLINTYLMGADFTGANLTGGSLERCQYDERTRWPAGYSPAPSTPVMQGAIASMQLDQYLEWKASQRWRPT